MLLDIIVILVVFLGGFKIHKLLNLNMERTRILNLLWIFQLLFSIFYFAYVSANGGDSWGYWHRPKEMTAVDILDYMSKGSGTGFMYVFNYIPSTLLDLSFLTGSILYGLVGYVGFLLWFKLFEKYIAYNSYLGKIKLFPLVFFLPNLHFWASGIGKDTLLFTCVALFVYGMQSPKKHVLKLLLAFIISYLIRPHITIFLIVATGTAFLIEGRLKLYQKIGFFLVFLIVFVALFDKIMIFLRIEDVSADSIQNFADTRVNNLSGENIGSSVDTSSYSLPFKIFTFLYRPLFYEARGILALLSSFENLFMLVLTIKLFLNRPFKYFKTAPRILKISAIFFVIGAISFSLILSNLGIMLRQKNMFTLAFIFLVLYVISKRYEEKTSLELSQ